MGDTEMTETCRCGASTTVKGLDRRDAADAIREWRSGHACIGGHDLGKGDPQPGGAGCATIGFAPTGVDMNPYGRVRRGVG